MSSKHLDLTEQSELQPTRAGPLPMPHLYALSSGPGYAASADAQQAARCLVSQIHSCKHGCNNWCVPDVSFGTGSRRYSLKLICHYECSFSLFVDVETWYECPGSSMMRAAATIPFEF